MATTIDPYPPPLTTPLPLPIPGGTGQPAMQGICVQPGDRLFCVCAVPVAAAPTAPPSDVVPDGTPGMGAGYMPHWCYRPDYARTQDLSDMVKGARLIDGINGNAGIGPVFRVDLQQIYCPWSGIVTIEGGASNAAQTTPTVLQIAYGWDQSGRQRQRWEETVAEMMRRVKTMFTGGAYSAGAPLKVMRFPVDMRTSPDMNGHTLTFVNPVAGGRALPINRPQGATSVWTPDAQTLQLDNGTGTTSVTVPTNGQSNRIPIGQYTRVTCVTMGAAVVFGVNF